MVESLILKLRSVLVILKEKKGNVISTDNVRRWKEMKKASRPEC